jgi:acetyltransferase-like isoleucine patch superfamily enzyme
MDGQKISVVLCTYNGEMFLEQQLLSLLNQTRLPDGGAFCGHNVMLITGTHDYRLMGEARHVAPKTGHDIRIGKYVWLCSGVTVLGDVSIGDNAVVAAGSIVTSGTRIPNEQIWGGIPAKFMTQIPRS